MSSLAKILVVMVSTLLSFGGMAATRDLPKEAYGPVGKALPPDARRIDPQLYTSLQQQRRLQPSSAALTREGIERAGRDREAVRRKLEGQLRGHPALLQQVTRKPSADGRRLRQRSDGSYDLRLSRNQTVRLENEDFLIRDVSDHLEALANPAVRGATYDHLRTHIARRVTDARLRSVLFTGLPASSREIRDAGQLATATDLLVSRFLQTELAASRGARVTFCVAPDGALFECPAGSPITGVKLPGAGGRRAGDPVAPVGRGSSGTPPAPSLPGPPAGYVANCALEEHAGSGGDRTGEDDCGFSANGLYQNADWPLKYRTTCVKNQGWRGTCVAFAITAAVEALLARDQNRWVNLSEQHMYYHEKNHWFSIPPNFGDGLITPLSVAAQMLGGFRYAYEAAWDYNPSWQREEVVNPPWELGYVNSCNGYNGTHCSDTNHQGDHVCTQKCAGIGPARICWEECGYTSSVSGNSQVRILSINPFFNLINPQAGADVAKAYLMAGVPVVVSLNVVQSFSAVSSDGYVSFVAGNEPSSGGHAVLATGYVPNSLLPAGAPQAAGGGYFVMKNSWGCAAGDGGYYYVPESWVIKNVVSMLAVTGVGT